MRVIMLSRVVATLGVVAAIVACSEDSLAPTPPSGSPGGSSAAMTVVPRTATIRAGQYLPLQARLIDEFGDALQSIITWTSSNDAVATVAATGEVYGRTEGHAVITASAMGKAQTSTIRVVARRGKPGEVDP